MLVVDRAVAWCVGFVAATKSSAQPLTLAEAKPNTARELHTARKQEIIAGSQLGSGPSVVRPNASRSAAKAVAFDILECVQKKRTPQNESGAAREPHPEWQRCVAPQYRPRHSHLGHSVRQCTSSASTMDIDRLELPGFGRLTGKHEMRVRAQNVILRLPTRLKKISPHHRSLPTKSAHK